MGDRSVVKFVYANEGEVNVYVHWLGSELPNIIAKALERNIRWNDDYYLSRIIISGIIKEAGVDDEYGVGIMPKNTFGEGGPIINLAENTVTLDGHWGGDSSYHWSSKVPDGTYSFSDYIAAINDVGDTLYDNV